MKHKRDRNNVTRNLEASFMSVDEQGIPIPKTASGVLMSVATYLQATQPPESDPRAALHRQQIKFLSTMGTTLIPEEPQPAVTAAAGNNTVNRRQPSPRRETRTREVTDRIARDRDRENRVIRGNDERTAPEQDNRVTRDRRNRGNHGHEERYQLNEGEDARNAITHNRVTRNRSRRAAQEEESDSSSSEDELEPCGALCFSRRIRETRMPKGFRLTSETPSTMAYRNHPPGWRTT